MTLYVAILFLILTPGILLSLPPKGSNMVVALTHGVVFSVVLWLTYSNVSDMLGNLSEGFKKKKKRKNKKKKKTKKIKRNKPVAT
jgi:Na+/melibiose symporter-like transporter